YATQTTISALQQLADRYHQLQLTEPGLELIPLCVNDASLPYGGLFDLGPGANCGSKTNPIPCQWWHPSHKTHGNGEGFDVNQPRVHQPPKGYCDRSQPVDPYQLRILK